MKIIEFIILKSKTKQNKREKRNLQSQMVSLENSTKIFKELTLILYNLFQKIKEEETFPNVFYEVRCTLMRKPNILPTLPKTKENKKLWTSLFST